jgi:hypothetical protein
MTAQAWLWAENPAYAGRTPARLEPACHDRSPLVTIVCGCGAEMHMHETQVAGQELAVVVSLCKGCGGELVFEPGWFAFAFADLRRRGWLAPREPQPHAMNGPDCTCPNDDFHQRVYGAAAETGS